MINFNKTKIKHTELKTYLSDLFMFLFFSVLIPSMAGADQSGTGPGTMVTAKAVNTIITETYKAVGTVKPRMETRIESQISAQVKKVHVSPGDDVFTGDIMITLDDRQAQSRLAGAQQAMKGAESAKRQTMETIYSARAALREAEQHYNRIKGYYKSNAATKQELEAAESAWLQARAGLSRAGQALKGAEADIQQAGQAAKTAEVGLGFTQIEAPFNGRVIVKNIEPGDLALPGKPLLTIRTETGFRIEANVPEGMINQIKKGAALTAEITSLSTTCTAKVEEIIPYADPQTRTFLVKAAIPSLPGLYPGMYGKLLIPMADIEVVLVPVNAVISIGQLEIVMVADENGFHKRYVKTGKTIDDKVEILSGIKGGETISYQSGTGDIK
ncbi:MAG: efflux RND transporter periplasmic adaptor subunit [Thermodesulfobacteriota bacterium]|nr:efflux RND transporter periplasmic adaptor subunit [Thermodesulfobacteriota bacterium]